MESGSELRRVMARVAAALMAASAATETRAVTPAVGGVREVESPRAPSSAEAAGPSESPAPRPAGSLAISPVRLVMRPLVRRRAGRRGFSIGVDDHGKARNSELSAELNRQGIDATD